MKTYFKNHLSKWIALVLVLNIQIAFAHVAQLQVTVNNQTGHIASIFAINDFRQHGSNDSGSKIDLTVINTGGGVGDLQYNCDNSESALHQFIIPAGGSVQFRLCAHDDTFVSSVANAGWRIWGLDGAVVYVTLGSWANYFNPYGASDTLKLHTDMINNQGRPYDCSTTIGSGFGPDINEPGTFTIRAKSPMAPSGVTYASCPAGMAQAGPVCLKIENNVDRQLCWDLSQKLTITLQKQDGDKTTFDNN